MEDGEFDALRDALSPENEATARAGALYLALASREEDDRIDSLIASLIQDRDTPFAASLAAQCWGDAKLRADFARELERVWLQKKSGYRLAILEALDDSGLEALAERYARDPDIELRKTLAARAAGSESDAAFEALLLLTHDDDDDVVCAALQELVKVEKPAREAVLARLILDTRADVAKMALASGLEFLPRPEVRERLLELENGDDLDLRTIAADFLGELRQKNNREEAEGLCAELQIAVDAKDRERIEAIAADIALLVPRHPEVEYQLARVAAFDGDARRALVTLHHLVGLGQEWRERARNEDDFLGLHGIEAWQAVIGNE